MSNSSPSTEAQIDSGAAPGAAIAEAAGTSTGAGELSALRSVGAHLRFWTVVVLGLVLDLWSKNWAFHTLRQGGGRPLIPKVLEFQTTLNPGALFGIGAGQTEIFLVASLLALVLVLWMFAQSPPRQWLMQIALGAILAGALGNMYDRVFVRLVGVRIGQNAVRYYVRDVGPHDARIVLTEYPPDEKADVHTLSAEAAAQIGPVDGHVRDFIKIPTRWFGEREIWPWVFNVADALLVCGVAILAWRLLRDRGARAEPAKADLDAGAGGS